MELIGQTDFKLKGVELLKHDSNFTMINQWIAANKPEAFKAVWSLFSKSSYSLISRIKRRVWSINRLNRLLALAKFKLQGNSVSMF